jgi:tetratricopeptide (TPR) repeat protein
MKKTLLLLFLSCFWALNLFAAEGDTVEVTVYGKLTYKSGNIVKIEKTDGDEMPAVLQEGVLSKKFETEMFGGTVSGWVSIGQMKVSSINGNIIVFALLKEMSEIIENGVKKDQFVIGRDVKFDWKIVVSPDEAAYRKGQDVVTEDVDKALEYYRRAISLNPRHAAAINMIGMIMNFKEEMDTAYVYFAKAASIDTKNMQYVKNAAITAVKLGKNQDAYNFAEKAVAIDPNDAESYFLRGLSNFFLHKESLTDDLKQKIIADIDKTIQLKPEDAYYYGERAFLRNEFGNTTGACEDARKAKELGSEDGDDLIRQYCP